MGRNVELDGSSGGSGVSADDPAYTRNDHFGCGLGHEIDFEFDPLAELVRLIDL